MVYYCDYLNIYSHSYQGEIRESQGIVVSMVYCPNSESTRSSELVSMAISREHQLEKQREVRFVNIFALEEVTCFTIFV